MLAVSELFEVQISNNFFCTSAPAAPYEPAQFFETDLYEQLRGTLNRDQRVTAESLMNTSITTYTIFPTSKQCLNGSTALRVLHMGSLLDSPDDPLLHSEFQPLDRDPDDNSPYPNPRKRPTH